ncbi:hypothetical protein AAE478_007349 [Parahypoxylon ruwenzoriense]
MPPTRSNSFEGDPKKTPARADAVGIVSKDGRFFKCGLCGSILTNNHKPISSHISSKHHPSSVYYHPRQLCTIARFVDTFDDSALVDSANLPFIQMMIFGLPAVASANSSHFRLRSEDTTGHRLHR